MFYSFLPRAIAYKWVDDFCKNYKKCQRSKNTDELDICLWSYFYLLSGETPREIDDLFYFKGYANKLHFHLKNEEAYISKQPMILRSDGECVAGWEQDEFLKALLYLLMYKLANIHSRNSSSDNTISNEQIEKLLITEIWIAANAFRLKSAYQHIPTEDLDENTDKKNQLTDYIDRFLEGLDKEILTLEPGEHFCFPCGYQGHATYLILHTVGHDAYLHLLDFSDSAFEASFDSDNLKKIEANGEKVKEIKKIPPVQ